jgi:capsular polysaccharide biosynthesis protein
VSSNDAAETPFGAGYSWAGDHASLSSRPGFIVELIQYWRILKRRWWLPVALAVLALMASAAVAFVGSAAYKTEFRLAISTLPTVERADSIYYDPVYYANLSSEYLADDLSELLRSQSFIADVGREIGQPLDASAIADVTRTKKTHRLIDVTISTPTREEGEAIARGMVSIVNNSERVGGYLKAMDAYHGQVSIVNEPVTRRGSGTFALIAEIGLRTLVGLLIGLGLAFVVDYVDQTIRTRRELEELLNLPILGEIPSMGSRRGAAA